MLERAHRRHCFGAERKGIAFEGGHPFSRQRWPTLSSSQAKGFVHPPEKEINSDATERRVERKKNKKEPDFPR